MESSRLIRNMDVDEALAILWREIARSSAKRVAQAAGLKPTTVSSWRSGQTPTGTNRTKLIAWAETVPDRPAVVAEATPAYRASWESGVRYSVAQMMRTLTDLIEQANAGQIAAETEAQRAADIAAVVQDARTLEATRLHRREKPA